jgi:hypothetical protein
MTEAEWLVCTEPRQMLTYLCGKMSHRKFRLFAVACCRPFWPLLTQQNSRDALLVAERFADGDADKSALELARKAMRANFRNRHREEVWKAALAETGDEDQANVRAVLWAGPWDSVHSLLRVIARDAAFHASDAVIATRTYSVLNDRAVALTTEKKRQVALLRDLCNNPFQHPPRIDHVCRTWSHGLLPKLAQALYDERAFERLPILADALEEAGCNDAAILAHCRGGGEHVRGCWVVDLLLGKA